MFLEILKTQEYLHGKNKSLNNRMEYCVSNDQIHCDQNCWWNIIAINLHIHMRHWQWLTVILPDPTLALVLLSIHLIPSVLFWVWRWLLQAVSHLVALLYTSMETTFLNKWSFMHLKIYSENKPSNWKIAHIYQCYKIPKCKLASRHVCLLIQQIQPKQHWWSDSHKYLNSIPLISNIVCSVTSADVGIYADGLQPFFSQTENFIQDVIIEKSAYSPIVI